MNRSKLITSVLIGLALISILIIASNVSRKPVKDARSRPSTVFTDNTGARASLLLLQRVLGYGSVTQFKEPLWDLRGPDEGGPGTLIVAGPSISLQPIEAEYLELWVESGGQLLLLLDEDWEVEDGAPFLARLRVRFKREGIALVASKLESSSLTLQVESRSKFEGDFEPFLVSEEQVLAVQIPIGEGRVIVFPDTSILLNRSLTKLDNAVWLVRLVEEWGNGEVAFDEFHHGLGQRDSFFDNVKGFLTSAWGLPFVHLGILGLFYAVVNRRRLGRAVEEVQDPLRDPRLLIEARAGFLKASRNCQLAVDRLCGELAHQLKGPSHRPADLEKLAEREPKVARLLELRQIAERGRLKEANLLDVCRLIAEIRKEHSLGS